VPPTDTNEPDQYSKPLRLLHWAMAALFLLLFISGPIMVDLDKTDPFRRELMGWHKSVGVLALLSWIARVAIRARTHLPALPDVFTAWEKQAAHWGHRLIYALMLVTPLTGWADSNLHGRPVKLFGLPLPTLFPKVEDIGTLPGYVHTVLAYTLMGLAALHVAAIIKHRYVDHTALLRRML